ncbi:FxDxF family PEP-CTERM protein [Methylotenera sp. 1P/1]|uniref:FxDxF family PEP-CTERM protein n=1 Tax=Methylotenera sp. 1P/1 TaxID=1131551 RepID=UPI0003A206CA|nr:FxDxF family PEP-CTERM protein [Methylotenera sp. 1P/1]
MKLATRRMLTTISLAAAFSISSVSAFADTTTVLTVGALPASLTYSNTFTSSDSGTTFWDDYIFTITDGSVNSVTSSINLDSILGVSDLRARLYKGSTHQTAAIAPNELISAWGTTVNYSPTVSSTTVVLNPLTLSAGTYTLQIKGIVSGSAGGSYAGLLNIATPVPEPETYAMLLCGMGLIGFMAKRRNTQA